jgi:hypothetical protein
LQPHDISLVIVPNLFLQCGQIDACISHLLSYPCHEALWLGLYIMLTNLWPVGTVTIISLPQLGQTAFSIPIITSFIIIHAFARRECG